MATRGTLKEMTDPRWAPVQMQIRVPFWRRAELFEKSQEMNVSMATLITDAIDRVYPPKPPK
jgi:hypothetical protein